MRGSSWFRVLLSDSADQVRTLGRYSAEFDRHRSHLRDVSLLKSWAIDREFRSITTKSTSASHKPMQKVRSLVVGNSTLAEM
jgi:hypothetical protein